MNLDIFWMIVPGLLVALVLVPLVWRERQRARTAERRAFKAEEAVERLDAELAVYIAAEREAAEVASRVEAQRAAAELAALAAARREAEEAAAQIELEQEAAIAAALAAVEREAEEVAARIEAAREVAARAAAEAQREAAEAAARVEAEREAAAAQALAAAEREAEVAAARIKAEREAADAATAAAEIELAEAAARAAAELEAAEWEARLIAEQLAAQAAAIAVQPKEPKLPAQTVVMIADDSKVVRVKTSRLLASQHYQVATADDGADAVKKIEASMPDLLITDVEMPGLDGFELTRHVRDNPRTSHIPIIMISSNSATIGARAAQAGVSVVMDKPYPEDELIAHIARLMT